MKITEIITEAANPAQQAAIAIAMKKAHKKPKSEGSLNEFASAPNPGGENYLQALASAWYNGTFNTGNLHKGIKSQEDVERILERGIHCGDGKIRKYSPIRIAGLDVSLSNRLNENAMNFSDIELNSIYSSIVADIDRKTK
jgi:hypothetical protein